MMVLTICSQATSSRCLLKTAQRQTPDYTISDKKAPIPPVPFLF